MKRFLLPAILLVPAVARAQLAAAASSPSPTPAIHDIHGPLDVFPYPLWMVLAAGGAALLLLALIVILIAKFIRSRPAPPPPTPREIALSRLREAEAHVRSDEPYRFSIRVSDILRQYIDAQFHLRAIEQTSPEFLASVSDSPRFKPEEKDLLAVFLDRCDLIKFARIDATHETSGDLLGQAVDFVKGGAA